MRVLLHGRSRCWGLPWCCCIWAWRCRRPGSHPMSRHGCSTRRSSRRARPMGLGTDDLGPRCLLPSALGWARGHVVAFTAGAVAVLGGTLLGLSAAYRRGAFDDVLLRLVEMSLRCRPSCSWRSFVTGFGQSVPVLIVAVAIIQMMGVVRTTRAAGIVLNGAGLCPGRATERRGPAPTIILRELLPNVADLMAVEFALRASSALAAGLRAVVPWPWHLATDARLGADGRGCDGNCSTASRTWCWRRRSPSHHSCWASTLRPRGWRRHSALDAARGGSGG